MENSDTSGTRVQVVIRVRPILPHEKVDDVAVTCSEDGARVQVLLPDRGAQQAGSSSSRYGARSYGFDACLNGSTTQAELFDTCGMSELVDAALDGYTVTIFAFGQTGSGKTHTMIGPRLSRAATPAAAASGAATADGDAAPATPPPPGGVVEEDGLLARCLLHAYQGMAERGAQSEFTTTVTCVELYNESVTDMLGADKNKTLQVRQDKREGFQVVDLAHVACPTAAVALRQLQKALAHRQTRSHKLNEYSSRSHCLMTFAFESKEKAQPGGGQAQGAKGGIRRHGKLTLVDLAGSERLKQTGNTVAEAVRETGAINKSLFTLGQVLASLCARSGGASVHVPYRDSKLTQLLWDGLRGTGRALMLGCMGPLRQQAEESLNTLHFASMAQRIKSQPIVLLDPQDQLVLDLRRTIESLRSENRQLSTALQQLANGEDVPSVLRTLPDALRDDALSSPSDASRPATSDGVLRGSSSPAAHSAPVSPLVGRFSSAGRPAGHAQQQHPPDIFTLPPRSAHSDAAFSQRMSEDADEAYNNAYNGGGGTTPHWASSSAQSPAALIQSRRSQSFRTPGEVVRQSDMHRRRSPPKSARSTSGGRSAASPPRRRRVGASPQQFTSPTPGASPSHQLRASSHQHRSVSHSNAALKPLPALPSLQDFPELAALEERFQQQRRQTQMQKQMLLAQQQQQQSDGGYGFVPPSHGRSSRPQYSNGGAGGEVSPPRRSGQYGQSQQYGGQYRQQYGQQYDQRAEDGQTASGPGRPAQVERAGNSPVRTAWRDEGEAAVAVAAAAAEAAGPAVVPEVKALSWAERNTWFGSHEEMTACAYAAHDALVDVEGVDPTSDRYYAELERRVRERYHVEWSQYKVQGSSNSSSAKPRPSNQSPPRQAASARSAAAARVPPVPPYSGEVAVPSSTNSWDAAGTGSEAPSPSRVFTNPNAPQHLMPASLTPTFLHDLVPPATPPDSSSSYDATARSDHWTNGGGGTTTDAQYMSYQQQHQQGGGGTSVAAGGALGTVRALRSSGPGSQDVGGRSGRNGSSGGGANGHATRKSAASVAASLVSRPLDYADMSVEQMQAEYLRQRGLVVEELRRAKDEAEQHRRQILSKISRTVAGPRGALRR